MCCMACTLNIRNFPDELLRRSKVKAAERGITLRKYAIEAIELATDGAAIKAELTIANVQKYAGEHPSGLTNALRDSLLTTPAKKRGKHFTDTW